MAQFLILALGLLVGGSQGVLAIQFLHRLADVRVQVMVAVFMPIFAQELVIIGIEFDRLQLACFL